MERFVMMEPKDPVAYPAYPKRPVGARRPVYREQEQPQQESEESRTSKPLG